MALSRSTVSKINEWVTWWNFHHNQVDSYPIEKKVQWMLKALQGAYDIMTMLARENHTTHKAFDMSDGGIALPKSWNFRARE